MKKIDPHALMDAFKKKLSDGVKKMSQRLPSNGSADGKSAAQRIRASLNKSFASIQARLGPKVGNFVENFPKLEELLRRLPRLKLAAILGLGILAGDASMQGLGMYLAKSTPPRRPMRRIHERDPYLESKNFYKVVISRNMFCPGCPIPELVPVKIEKPRDCNQAQPADGSLKLIGTIVLSDAQYSVATITAGSGEGVAVQKGDKVPGIGEILEIKQGRVCYISESEDVFALEIADLDFIPAADFTAQAPKSGAARRTKVAGIDQVSEDEYQISRTLLLEKLNDPNLLYQAHAIPQRGPDGGIEGFKILSIQPGSVYESLGIQVGDTIREVDGEQLNSIAKVQKLYEAARSTAELNLGLERSGKPVNKKYSIK